MIVMLVGDKNGLHMLERKSQSLHTFFRFTAGQTGINQDGFTVIADVVAVAIAAGIQRSDI